MREQTDSRIDTFPYLGSTREKFRYLVRYAILAPSIQNSQPWKFRMRDDAVFLLADRSRALPIVDPDGRELAISAGAALHHLTLAMRCHGMLPSVAYLPDPTERDVLARIEYAGEYQPDSIELSLLRQISHRHTGTVMEEDPVPSFMLADLEHMVEGSDCRIIWVGHGPLRLAVAEMVQESDKVLFSGERFREEFAAWVRPRRRGAVDGIPADKLGFKGLLSWLAPWLIQHVNLGKANGRDGLVQAATAPALGILCTRDDNPVDWLNAGQALARLWLRATEHGLRCAVLYQPLEVPGVRERLRRDLRLTDYPQAILRIGIGPEGEPTPRRTVDAFIEEAVCWPPTEPPKRKKKTAAPPAALL